MFGALLLGVNNTNGQFYLGFIAIGLFFASTLILPKNAKAPLWNNHQQIGVFVSAFGAYTAANLYALMANGSLNNDNFYISGNTVNIPTKYFLLTIAASLIITGVVVFIRNRKP